MLIKNIIFYLCLICVFSINNTYAQHLPNYVMTGRDTLSFRYGKAPTAAYLSGIVTEINSVNANTNYYADSDNNTFGHVGSDMYYLLFKFEGLSDWIPAGSNIISATLYLTCTGQLSSSYDSDSMILVGIHRIFMDWDEATVTWNSPWNSPGLGDTAGAWDNPYGIGLGYAYIFQSKRNNINANLESAPPISHNNSSATIYPTAADTLDPDDVEVSNPIDRLVFADDYTDIDPYVDNAAPTSTTNFMFYVNATEIVTGFFHKNWNDAYGFCLRVEKTVGGDGKLDILNHTAGEILGPSIFRPQLTVIYEYAIESEGGDGGGSGGVAIGRTLQGLN